MAELKYLKAIFYATYRKTGIQDPSGTLQKPENREASGTLQKPENRYPSVTLQKSEKPGTGTLVGP